MTDHVTPAPNDYTSALKKTIFTMYARLMSAGKPMKHGAAREIWDKNWWAKVSKEASDKSLAFETSANGWLLLEKFWGEIYLAEDMLPVGINYEFSTDIEGLSYRIHQDLTFSSKDGNISIMELGGSSTEWQFYTSLGTKLEICGLEETLGRPPTRKVFIDLESRNKDYIKKELAITPEYMEHSKRVVAAVSRNIRQGITYTSPSKTCETCPWAGKCWI
jgi:hypothetical protein